MCWPQVVGGVEIEERRPRNWNEPRRKRLNFVRGDRRHSDEWVPASPRRPTEREIWDRRRAREMEQQRLMHPFANPQLQGHFDPRIVHMPHDVQPLHHIQPGHHGHQPGFDPQAHYRPQGQLDRRSHHSEDDITTIEDLGHDGHDDHDGQHHLEPRIIPIKPLQSKLPKGLQAHAKKRRRSHKTYATSSSSDASSSPDRSSGFSEGFRAGRRSLSRRPVPRGRSRSRLTDDSFEDLMHTPLRSSSRRGRY